MYQERQVAQKGLAAQPRASYQKMLAPQWSINKPPYRERECREMSRREDVRLRLRAVETARLTQTDSASPEAKQLTHGARNTRGATTLRRLS